MVTIEHLYSIFTQSAGVSTDTRSIRKDSIFFALKGDNFDGNKFADDALAKGASHVVCDNPSFIKDERYLLTNNVLDCLQRLAKYHRLQLNRCKWLSITGSNGKTTSKELIAKVLAKKYNVVFTKGNLNNHIGVPLTILSIKEAPDFAIIEMGANHQKEIEFLMEIALPDYGYITNFGLAHLEGMGGPEGVVKAKSEMFNFLKDHKGFVFINASDHRMMKNSDGINRLVFGEIENSFAMVSVMESNPYLRIAINFQDRKLEIATQMVGHYNKDNILAAACIGAYFNVSDEMIAEAIASYNPDNNRSQFEKTENNLLLLDAYNANPSSMKEAIVSFAAMPSDLQKCIILGAMMELGEQSKALHEEILQLAIAKKFESIFTVGQQYVSFFEGQHLNFENTANLKDYLGKHPIRNKCVLVKGSRTNQLEQIKDLI